jgi:CHAD domain-containing protein
MDSSNLTPSRFIDEYEKLWGRVGEGLRLYLGDPNEENTRNLRASVRRLASFISLIPEKARDKSVREMRRRSRKLLSLTSKMRDIDIIRVKLAKRPTDPTVELLLRNMAEERETFAADSMRTAWKLFELKRAKLAKKDVSPASRWARDALEDLDKLMLEESALVVKNEGRIEELHSLRKHAKRFRYALELVPSTVRSASVVQILKTWQDILGEVRDADVLIEYLGRARASKSVRDVLVAERTLRHKRYVAFVRSWQSCFPEKNRSLLTLAGFKTK